MFWTRSCAVAIAALGSLAQVQAKAVFAHFMVRIWVRCCGHLDADVRVCIGWECRGLLGRRLG